MIDQRFEQVIDARRTGVEIVNNMQHGTTVFDANGRVLAHYDALGQPAPQVITREIDDSAVVVASVAIIAVALVVIFWP